MNEHSSHWTRAAQLGLDRSTASTASHVSPEIYAKEVDRIFRRLWLIVGRVEDIPGPGDYFLRPIPTVKAELIVARGKDDVIRAFYNSCAHRGVPVVYKEKGTALTFRCPYHSWLYGVDGTLRAIASEEQFPCVDKASNGLVPVSLDIWNGFIFVNFDPEPAQSLTEFLGGLGELHGTLPFERYPFYVRADYDVASNWKSGMNTFSEGYHITTAHSRTLTPQIVTKTNPTFNFYDIRIFGPHSTLTSERNFEWRPKNPTMLFVVDQLPPSVLPKEGSNERDFATHPSINRIGLPNFGVETITIFPNICLQPLGGGYLWMTFWPVAPDRTLVEVRSYSSSTPVGLRQEFATAFAAAAARDVLSEDFSLTEQQQRVFAMGARANQNFGENEPLLRYFTKAVDHYLHDDEPLPAMLMADQNESTDG